MGLGSRFLIILIVSFLGHLSSVRVWTEPTPQWSFVPGGELSGPPVWASDGRVVFAGEDRWLYALNDNGGTVWRYDLRRLPVTGVSVANDGTAFVGLSPNQVTAITPSGRGRWSVFGRGRPVAVIPSPSGLVYTVFASGELTARTNRGSLVWTTTLSSGISAPPVVDAHGRLVVAQRDGTLSGFDFSGRRVWTVRFSEPVNAMSAGAGLLVADRLGNLRLLDVGGNVQWSVRVSGAPIRSILIDDTGEIAVTDEPGQVIRISAGGAVIWRAQPPGTGFSTAALSASGTVYGATFDGRMIALDREGRLLFESAAERHRPLLHLGIAPSGRLIGGSSDWVVDFYCVDSCAPSEDIPANWAHPRGGSDGAAVSAGFSGFKTSVYRDVLDYIFLDGLARSDLSADHDRFLSDIEQRVLTDRVGIAHVYLPELLISIAQGGVAGRPGAGVLAEHRLRAFRLLGEIGDHRISSRFATALATEPLPVIQAAIIAMMGRIESDPSGDAIGAISALVRRDVAMVSAMVGNAAAASLQRMAEFNSARNREIAVDTLVWMSASTSLTTESRMRARDAIRAIE